jgi:hypothetical protein
MLRWRGRHRSLVSFRREEGEEREGLEQGAGKLRYVPRERVAALRALPRHSPVDGTQLAESASRRDDTGEALVLRRDLSTRHTLRRLLQP